ncbi:hypothetical protein OV450_8488 [Actinobacteria bacterium OV450]|nr:hypothetical protein OV450_8488 [Actinobacteria bacterium OV450]
MKNTGVLPLDMLNNRYLNLQQCVYTSTENFTTYIPGGNPAYGGNTNASDTADTAPNCRPGTPPIVPNVNNTRVLPLDTLDTTRGRGFVEFRMYAPIPDVTTTYPESTSMTGSQDSSGTVTVLVLPIPNAGDWGFPLGVKIQVPAGLKVDPAISWTCDPLPSILPVPDTSPCEYVPSMRLVIHALHGAEFLDNTVTDTDTSGAQWDLVKKSTKARVGTCFVASKVEVQCRPTGIGSVSAGDSLETAIPVEFVTASTAATPTLQATWWNPGGEPQRGSDGMNDLWGQNDFLTFATTP